MNISVVICAHNEETNLPRCLKSVLKQDPQPLEVLVVAHNCTDKTAEIARAYGARVVELGDPPGLVYARQAGFEAARGEIIASIDADSEAFNHSWLRKLTAPLQNPAIAGTGGFVLLHPGFRIHLTSLGFFYIRRLFDPRFHFYFWGPNFACRKKDFEKVGGLKPFFELKPKLNLTWWADDLYLSLALEKLGRIVFVPDAWVRSLARPVPPGSTPRDNRADRRKIMAYFGV